MYNIKKQTKIVCTIGPASESYEVLAKLVKAGMNVMRLNFSHGTYDEHLKKINNILRLEQELGVFVPIMLDTKGPEIRCHMFENDGVELVRDEKIRISMSEVLGTKEKFSVTHSGLYNDVKVGDLIKIDDGKLSLEIIEKDASTFELVCLILNSHFLKNRKGVNAPFARLSMPYISERDEADLKFGCENHADMVAASFVRRPEDIHEIRRVCSKYGRPEMRVIAKIENREALNNIDEIIAESDEIGRASCRERV